MRLQTPHCPAPPLRIGPRIALPALIEATLYSAFTQLLCSLPEQYFTLFCRCGTWLLRALLRPCDRCLSVHCQSAASLCYAVPSLCQSKQHPCTQVCTLPTLCHSLPTFADVLPFDRSRAVAPPCIAFPCRCAVCPWPALPCRCYAILVPKSCAVAELFVTYPRITVAPCRAVSLCLCLAKLSHAVD